MPTIPEETTLPGIESFSRPMVDSRGGTRHDNGDGKNLVTTGPRSMDVDVKKQRAVKYGNERGIPISQATIPQFFGNKGSKMGIAQETQPVTGVIPRRINPTRIEEENVIKDRPSVSFADQDNVMNETTAFKR